ncbi:MAG TPA: GDSL-type esterase/lipase family protein, partial [Catenuloplanes sp.]
MTFAPSAAAAIGDGGPADANIRYLGRWDPPSATTAVGHWSAPYLRAAFTGTTIRVKLRDRANIYVSIDGQPDVFHQGVRGTVNLTPTPLAAGTHQLWIAFRGGAAFQGFVLGAGAGTVAPTVSDTLVEYVGDSITFGATSSKLTVTSYGWVASEQLGVEHATVARSGGCLVSRPDCFGLSVNYVRKGVGLTEDWDFARYRADAVVINMGTNDAGRGVTAADFGSAYLRFLRDIRARRPNAALFVFQNFRQRYVAEHQAAVRTLHAAGDLNVHYVGTAGWLTDADYTDGGHPNDAGHRKVADRLAPILAPHLGGPTAAVGDGSTTDPNIAFVGRWDRGSTTAFVSNWAGAYLRTGFTGTTVRLRQRNPVDLWASIDGGEFVSFRNVSGTVNLTPTPRSAGNHTLMVSYRQVAGAYRGDAVFTGLTLDPGARTYALPVRPGLVEFVGDSITAGATSSKLAVTDYAFVVGERLGVDHTQITIGGMCLAETADGCWGHEGRYFLTNGTLGTAAWDFSRYQAEAVVINLGTNDRSHGVAAADFQAKYTTFLRDVRARYPRAALLALRTFIGRYAAETEAAVRARNAAGDANVHYV